MALITIGRKLSYSVDSVTSEQNPASPPYRTMQLGQLVPYEYDDVELIYTGTDLTSVVYRSSSVVVATLTLTWVGGNLTRVVRS